jgi:hypothetical protein
VIVLAAECARGLRLEQTLEARGKLGGINAEITEQCTNRAFIVNE